MKNPLHLVLLPDYVLPGQSDFGKIISATPNVPTPIVWKNDEVVIPVALLSEDSLVSNASVKFTDFVSGDGNISGDSIRWKFLHDTKAFMGNGKSDNGSRELFADILYSNDAVDIPASRIRCAWITIPVPKDAPCGTYKGEIIAQADGCDDVAQSFSFEVINLIAPDAKDYTFDAELWQYPYRTAQYYSLEPFGDEHMEVLRNHMQLYKRIGGHAITASIVEEPWNGQTYGKFPSMIKWKKNIDKTFSYDYTDFDKWIALCKDIGICDKIVCYSIIPWANKIAYFDEKRGKMNSISPKTGTGKHKRIWKHFLRELMQHAEEKGYFDDIYIGIDERRKMDKAFDVIESVKNAKGKSFKKSIAMDHFNAKFFPVIDRIDSVSIGSEAVKKATGNFATLIEHRKADANRKTTIYTCVGHFPNSFTYSIPCESYWTMLFCAKMGTTGYLRWALDAWVEDPLRDTTHVSFEAGDCFMLYPDEKNGRERQSKTSVRFEMLAKGLRDVNKLRIIADTDSTWKNLVDDLLSTVKPTYSHLHDGIPDAKCKLELPQDMSDFADNMYQLFKNYANEHVAKK